eukprot:1183715-Prorocentrum_minimum.AAC.1
MFGADILSPLLRLVSATGILSLPFCDWCPWALSTGLYPRFPKNEMRSDARDPTAVAHLELEGMIRFGTMKGNACIRFNNQGSECARAAEREVSSF